MIRVKNECEWWIVCRRGWAIIVASENRASVVRSPASFGWGKWIGYDRKEGIARVGIT